MKNKLDINVRIKTLLTDLKIANRIIKFIRYDDAGEKMTIKIDPEIKSSGIKFEFLGPRTPQRNEEEVSNTLWKNAVNVK
jgi:hypothetical protein